MQRAIRRFLTIFICLCPSHALAQSITTAPVAPVPVGAPWLVLALGLMLIGGAYLILRNRAAEGGAGLAALAVAVTLGAAFVLHAQATLTFTDPEGETLAIPITPEASGDDVTGWEPADFTNNSGVTLAIDAIDAPSFSECFPGGLDGELLAGSSDPSPHPTCAVGDTLADGATCRVDVEARCRAAAAGNLATLTSISPATGTAAGGTSVTLTGTNLSGATAVTFDGIAATSVAVVDGTTVTATTPAHAAGGVDVVISTPAGSATLDDGFTYAATVTLTAVTAASGSASGGLGVTLTGTGLTGTTSVTFDGMPATSVNVVNSTTVTAVTPAHAAGVVDVVLSAGTDTGTLPNGFTYVATAVGQQAHGGIIAALNGGLNNLIASAANNATLTWWGPSTLAVGPGAQSNTDGASNTAAIVSALGNNGGTPYAAGVCSAYEVDSQGNTPCQAGNTCYDDWFLPAGNNTTPTGQLNALYTNRVAIGGFSPADYWSSTEGTVASTTVAWFQSFFNGGEVTNQKDGLGGTIRCVRAFTP